MSLRTVVQPVIAVLAALLLVAALGVGAVSANVTPTTLTNRPGYRVDVENPAPSVRPEQLHLQDSARGKYRYDFEAGQRVGLPRSIQRQIVDDPAVALAIATGRRHLGLDP